MSASQRQLRAVLRERRDAIAPAARLARSHTVCDQILESLETLGLLNGRALPTVALYRAMGSELVLDELVASLARRARLVAPVTLCSGLLAFVEVSPEELWVTPDYLEARTPENFLALPWKPLEQPPVHRVVVALSEITCAIVPGVGFDRSGGRLGYGGGYYDRTLAQPLWHALRWGVCFEEQLCPGSLPLESHDVPMDRVFSG